jgi:hypothetical protein
MQDAAPKETSPEGITPIDAIVGQFLYTASHEMGHAVFDLLNVPLFGTPENDADQFAAHVLMTIGKQDARRLIMGAAYMYKDYFKNPTITVPVTAFADIHGAPDAAHVQLDVSRLWGRSGAVLRCGRKELLAEVPDSGLQSGMGRGQLRV